MNIFATGTTGTIGKHLANQVVSIDIDLLSPLEDFYRINLNNDSCIIHLAGVVGPTLAQKDIEVSHQINVQGARKLATVALEADVKRFIYVSSSHVYKQSRRALSEDSDLGPISIYAQQKLKAEQEVSNVFQSDLGRLCIVRVFSVLDWDVQDYTLGDGIKKLARLDPDFELRNSEDVRDFLTPKTIAKALVEIANEPRLTGVVNMCTGRGLTVRDAVFRMLTESGFKPAEAKFRPGKSAVPSIVGDNTKLLSILPNLSLEWSPSRFSGN